MKAKVMRIQNHGPTSTIYLWLETGFTGVVKMMRTSAERMDIRKDDAVEVIPGKVNKWVIKRVLVEERT